MVLLQQSADGPTGLVVPTSAEIQEWRPGSSRLWRSFPKGNRHNVKYLKKSVQSIAQVRTLAQKYLEMNCVFPQSLSSLAPGQQQSSARRRVVKKDDYLSSALALLSIRTSPVRVFPPMRPWDQDMWPVVRVNVKVIISILFHHKLQSQELTPNGRTGLTAKHQTAKITQTTRWWLEPRRTWTTQLMSRLKRFRARVHVR